MTLSLNWESPITVIDGVVCEASYAWLVAEHGPPPPDPALVAAVRAAVTEALAAAALPPAAPPPPVDDTADLDDLLASIGYERVVE